MPTALNSGPQVVAANLTDNSSIQEHNLGERVVSPDGRAFRYAKAGELLVAGTLLQAPAEITNHQNLVPTAAAIGATSVTVTLGATAVTANQYAGGYMLGSETPGEGQLYLILSHPAAALSATVALSLADPLVVALTSSSHVDLILNQYSGVIINPASASSCPVGVAVTAISSGQFGWVQTGGVANILNDGGSTVGTNVSASNAVAGAVEAQVTAQASVGVAVTGIANTENGAIRLFDI